MAQFKILLLNIHSDTNLTNGLKVLTNTMSEYIGQEQNNNLNGSYSFKAKHNYCYTYNEKFKIGQNSQKTLSFSMDSQIVREDRIEENPFIHNLHNGSQILLIDKDDNHHLFTVNKISYTFKNPSVLVYNYDCQDSFTYQLSRQNNGYTIENNIESADFLGAHSVDWWTKKMIVPDCHISYQYIGLTENFYLNSGDILFQEPDNVQKVLKKALDPDSAYLEEITFSGSGTANSILISLGEQLSLNLKSYERLIGDILYRYFWFEPKKKDAVTGLTYSPYSDIQNFSLTHTGTALSTVLNVSGEKFGDEQVTLLPNLPTFFRNYFTSKEWDNSVYSLGMFTSICQNKTYTQTLNTKALTKATFLRSQIPNMYKNGKFFQTGGYLYIPVYDSINEDFFRIPQWYDFISFSKEKEFSSIIANINELTFISGNNNWQLVVFSATDLLNPIEISVNKTSIPEVIRSQSTTLYPFVKIQCSETINFISSLQFYLTFYRNATEEELQFAEIADQCPWLENKLIDFNYYYKNNILNYSEYSNLMNIISNELRINNGRLMLYAQQYYAAIHHQTQVIADLTTKIDSLGANFNAELLSYYKHGKTLPETPKEFQTAYDLLFNVPNTYSNAQLLFEYNKLLGDYVNKYIDTEQRFLKNCYNFRKFFNERINFVNEDATLHNITINFNTTPSYYDATEEIEYTYGFSQPQWISLSNNFTLYDNNTNSDTYGTIYTDIYYKSQSDAFYTKVDTNNLLNKEKWLKGYNKDTQQNDLYYQPQYKVGSFKEITTNMPFDEDIEYYETAYRFVNSRYFKEIKYLVNGTQRQCDFQMKKNDNGDYEYVVTASVILFINGSNPFNSIVSLIGITENSTEYQINNIEKTIEKLTWSKMLKSYWNYWKIKGSYDANDQYYSRSKNNFYSIWNTDLTDTKEPLLLHHTSAFTDVQESYVGFLCDNNWWRWLPSSWAHSLSRFTLSRVTNNALEENDKALTWKAYLSNFPITNAYYLDYVSKYDSENNIYTIQSMSTYQSIPIVGYTNFSNYYRRITTTKNQEIAKWVLGTTVHPMVGAIWWFIQTARSYTNDCFGTEGITYKSAEDDNIGVNFDSTYKIQDYNSFLDVLTQHGVSHYYYWFTLTNEGLDFIFQHYKDTVRYNEYSSQQKYKVNDIVQYNNNRYYCIKTNKGQIPTDEEYWKLATGLPTPGQPYFSYDNYFKWFIPHYQRFFSNRGSSDDFMQANIKKFFYQSDDFIRILTLNDKINKKDTYYVLFQEKVDGQKTTLTVPFCDESSTSLNVILDINDSGIENFKLYNQTHLRYNMIHNYPLQHYFIPLETNNLNCLKEQRSTSLVNALAEVFGVPTNRFSVDPNEPYSAIIYNNGEKYFYVVHEEKYSPIFLQYWNYDGIEDDQNGDYTNFVQNTVKLSQVYRFNDDSLVDFRTEVEDFIVPGILYQVNKDENFEPSTEFSLDGNYYRKIGEKVFEKVYVVNELKNRDYYYQKNLSYNIETLAAIKDDKYSITTNLYKYKVKKTTSGEVQYYGQQSYDSILNNVEFVWNIDETSGEIIIEGNTYQFSASDIQTLIGNLTNGEYWYSYKNAIDNATLMQYAGLIETTLTEYWTEAYNASFYCQWFLPQYWQQYVDNESNPFFKKIITYKENNIGYGNKFSTAINDLQNGQLVSDGWYDSTQHRYLSEENYKLYPTLLGENATHITSYPSLIQEGTSSSYTFLPPAGGAQTAWEMCESDFASVIFNNDNLMTIVYVNSIHTENGWDEDVIVNYKKYYFDDDETARALRNNPMIINNAEIVTGTQFFIKQATWNLRELNQLRPNCYYLYLRDEAGSYGVYYQIPYNFLPNIAEFKGAIVNDHSISQSLILTNYYLPEVEIYSSDSKYRYINYTDEGEYYSFITENSVRKTLDQHYYPLEQVISQPNLLPVADAFNTLNLSNDGRTGYWAAVKLYDKNTYYHYVGGGRTWSAMVGEITNNVISAAQFSGWYNMMIAILTNGSFANQSISDYEYYQNQHNKIWHDLYNLYPNVILEGSYTNKDATTSLELYNAAKLAFNDYLRPEAQYNITTIDINHLRGYKGQELDIGEIIDLASEELYNNYDEIKTSLQQHLFITDINYTLRSDKDISIGVNTVKYGDKVVKELIKLIR